MQSQLSIGDEVMLSSGFYGIVHGLSEDSDGRVHLELSEGVMVSVARGAITEVLTRSADADVDSTPEAEYAAAPENSADDATPNASDPQKPSES